MARSVPNFDFQDTFQTLHDAIHSFISDEEFLRIPEAANRVEEYAKCSGRLDL